jgi:hypothetical protein
MNAATENNNELGISLLLGGVRGGYLYRVDRKGGFACSSTWGIVFMWLGLSSR